MRAWVILLEGESDEERFGLFGKSEYSQKDEMVFLIYIYLPNVYYLVIHMGKLWSVYVPNGLNNAAEEVLKSETFKSRSELVRTALRQLLKETKGEKTNV